MCYSKVVQLTWRDQGLGTKVVAALWQLGSCIAIGVRMCLLYGRSGTGEATSFTYPGNGFASGLRHV